MDENRHRSGRGPTAGDTDSSESQASAPPPGPIPLPSLTSTWAESIGTINMSQSPCTVSAPADGGTNVYVTVNNSNPENTPTTDAQGGDFSHHSDSNINQDPDDFVPTARADHKIYFSHLLTKERGFPLWAPGPGMQLPIEYRRQGLSIGDVGIITSIGAFDFLFNIFHPADHPINDGMVPAGFLPLSPQNMERDVQKAIHYGPNTYLTSSSVRKTRSNWSLPFPFYTSEASIGQSFESTATEAAILIMPKGAKTEDLLNTRAFDQVVSLNAREWFRYARYTRGRNVKNGGIRVVVGVDKVSAWGIATSSCNTGQTASFVFKRDSTHTYKWDCIGGSGRVGPQQDEIQDLMEDDGIVTPQNQCAFVRTMNCTLSDKAWREMLTESEVTQQPGPESGKFDHQDSASSKEGGSTGGHGSLESGSSSSDHQAGPMPGSLQCGQSVLVNSDPREQEVNHPSVALHNYLHEKFPYADMVITEDVNWISVLNDDEVVFPKPKALCVRVLSAHSSHIHEGIVRLIRNKDFKSQPKRVLPAIPKVNDSQDKGTITSSSLLRKPPNRYSSRYVSPKDTDSEYAPSWSSFASSNSQPPMREPSHSSDADAQQHEE